MICSFLLVILSIFVLFMSSSWWVILVINYFLPCQAGDMGLIPGLRRFPGEGNGNPLQYSCLGNLMDRGAWQAAVHGVAKKQMRLSKWTWALSLLVPLPINVIFSDNIAVTTSFWLMYMFVSSIISFSAFGCYWFIFYKQHKTGIFFLIECLCLLMVEFKLFIISNLFALDFVFLFCMVMGTFFFLSFSTLFELTMLPLFLFYFPLSWFGSYILYFSSHSGLDSI